LKSKAELKKQYKETPIAMGIFLVRNTKTNEFVLGASRNLAGSLNLFKSVLKMGKATDLLLKNPKIMEDYRTQGAESFEFTVLDNLKPQSEPGWDPGEDLKALEKLWREELMGKGWKAY